MKQLNTPIAYFIFNRPLLTRQSFSMIKLQKPKKLLLIADGPRYNSHTDQINCKAVREIVNSIDWPCKIYRNFSETNMGMKQRNISGLDWAFSITEDLIILEDDNLPNQSFFEFMSNFINYYKNNNKIFQISGVNWIEKKIDTSSYYFSKYNNIWGWGTWKRSWKKFDPKILQWPNYKLSKSWLIKCPNVFERYYWEEIFNKYYSEDINSWAYAWLFSAFYNNGLTVVPNKNLVQNLGMDGDGTHKFNNKKILLKKTELIPSTWVHPKKIAQNTKIDYYVFNKIFYDNKINSTKNKIKVLIKKLKNQLNLFN